jgi:RND superfamily putative drug exporter
VATLARWCFRHRAVVVALWITGLLALGAAGQVIGSQYSDDFSISGTESADALRLLESGFPGGAGDASTVVWHVDGGTVRDRAVVERMSPVLDRLAHLPHVEAVAGPYVEQGAGQVSADGRTAYATVEFDRQAQDLPKAAVRKVVDTATAAQTVGLQVELGGTAVADGAEHSTGQGTALGVIAAGVVLFVAFGSLLAMLLPLVTALIALGAGLSAIALLSHVVGMASFAPTLAALIGLGVGVDYALFVVTRHRTCLRAGDPPEAAAITASNTAGRAVLFAGATVCISLTGIFVLGLSALNGVAIAAIVAVLFTVAAAVTLLPALLGFLGMRALSPTDRLRMEAGIGTGADRTGYWARWARSVARRPGYLSLAAVLVMLILAIPFVSLRLGVSDHGNDPSTATTRKAYDLLADGFGPGVNGPLLIVAELRSPADRAAVEALTGRLRATPTVASVGPPTVNRQGTVAVVSVVPTTAPQAEATARLITRLRDDVIPAAEDGSTMRAYVSGQTALSGDFADLVHQKLPYVVGVIVLLGCLLLLIAFRSLLVPLTAAAMNVIAAAASFGVLVAVFQWGWGTELLRAGGPGPVEAFLPVMLLAILFGLSMDYQVFLVSRIREEWLRTGDNSRAVTVGLADTARVITAAATVMILVFASFAFGGERVIAEFGIGLGAAVLLDAFIVRTALVPGVMHLMGSANWWLPRLPRLPRPTLRRARVPAPAAVPASGTEAAGGSPRQLPRPRRRRWAVVGTSVLALTVVSTGVGLAAHGAAQCGDSADRLVVVATPEIAPTVRAAVKAMTRDAGSCSAIRLTERSSAAQAGELLSPRHTTPAVWIPDSSLWPQRLAAQGVTLPLRNPSVALSPVVLAVPKSQAERSGWPGRRLALSAVVGSGAGGPVRLGLPDLGQSASAVAAVLDIRDAVAGTAHPAATLAGVLRGAHATVPPDPAALLETAVGDDALAVPVSEQTVAVRNLDRGTTEVVAAYPATRAMSLDYPFVTVATDGTRAKLAARLLDALRDTPGQAQLWADGFRNAEGAAGPVLTGGVGVDPAPTARMYVPTAEEVRAAEQTLRTLRLQSRMLTVMDLSGSMGQAVPGMHGKTRLELMEEAAALGLGFFPDDAEVGLWGFSLELAGGRDYRELVPIGPLGPRADGVTGRARLVDAMTSLRPHTGTGLYDTTLAAVRAARAGWDPARSNVVVLLTDGRNEDSRGITLRELATTLQRENTHGRPVPVIAIAYGPDSDVSALRTISTATGGRLYVASDPRQIRSVFLDAVGRRVCRTGC